ncbi:MAG TPA: hypothetical protein VGD62_13680 [Acidobacteriaceae bacterium]
MMGTIPTRRLLAALVAMVCAGVPAARAGGPAAVAGRFAIDAGQVLAALQGQQFDLDHAQVKLMVGLSARTAAPVLRVEAVERAGQRGAHVRLSCGDHGECLPFYVSVIWEDADAAEAALGSFGAPVHGARRGMAAATQVPAAGAASRDAAAVEPGLHAGSHAMLLLEGARLHIQVPVICLEAGAPGRSIRVSALDHKQTYVAQVIDTTLLRGTL